MSRRGVPSLWDYYVTGDKRAVEALKDAYCSAQYYHPAAGRYAAAAGAACGYAPPAHHTDEAPALVPTTNNHPAQAALAQPANTTTPAAAAPITGAVPTTMTGALPSTIPNIHNFTPEQDAALLKSNKERGEGGAWQKVADDVGKTVKECKTRIAELSGKMGGGEHSKEKETGQAGVGGDKEKDKGKSKDQNKGGKGGDTNRAGNDGKGGKGAKDGAGQNTIELVPDENFSASELRTLGEIIHEYQSMTWYHAASKFFDKTGRTLHPLDVKDKFPE